MTTEIEGPDMGSWWENLPNRSIIKKGVADSNKWLKQWIETNKTRQQLKQEL